MKSWIVSGWGFPSVLALPVLHICRRWGAYINQMKLQALSSLKKAREKVLNSCCLWLIGKMPVFEESQTCSENFSGNQRCTGGFSCIPGLSGCVQSIKQALMLKRDSRQLLSFHLKLVRNLLWKVFLLEERKKVSLKDQCHHRERKWLINTRHLTSPSLSSPTRSSTVLQRLKYPQMQHVLSCIRLP